MNNNIINYEEEKREKEKTVERILEWQERMIEKFGYYYHYVCPENSFDLADFHTHGLKESINHKELQIKTQTNKDLCVEFLDIVISKIKNSETKNILDITLNIEGKPIKYKELKNEFGEDIIRLIIPDNNGKYPWDDECEEDYKKQWTMEDEINAKK